ncbi:hypothetical protein [Williamsia muralis]|uniref:hypothetical protein n=1 Tax=Williamsia marianensis TaxID=85044 RepID=UPI00381D72B3
MNYPAPARRPDDFNATALRWIGGRSQEAILVRIVGLAILILMICVIVFCNTTWLDLEETVGDDPRTLTANGFGSYEVNGQKEDPVAAGYENWSPGSPATAVVVIASILLALTLLFLLNYIPRLVALVSLILSVGSVIWMSVVWADPVGKILQPTVDLQIDRDGLDESAGWGLIAAWGAMLASLVILLGLLVLEISSSRTGAQIPHSHPGSPPQGYSDQRSGQPSWQYQPPHTPQQGNSSSSSRNMRDPRQQ